MFILDRGWEMYICIQFIDFIEYIAWLVMPVNKREEMNLDLAASAMSNKLS